MFTPQKSPHRSSFFRTFTWRRASTAAAAVLLLIVLGALFSFAATVSEFLQYDYDIGTPGMTTSGRDMPGMLFIPTNLVATQKYPLVIYLHGFGEQYNYSTNTNNNLNAQVKSGNPNNIVANAKTRQFYIYAPQTPHPSNNWRKEYFDDIMKMVSRIIRDYNVDPHRIYLTGLSMGGAGTYTGLSEYRDPIAAAVPISGDLGDSYRVAQIAGKPMWIYHATNDPSANTVQYSRQRVQDLRAYHGLAAVPSWPLDKLATNHPLYNTGLPYYTNAAQPATYYADDHELRYTEYKSGGHSVAVWGRAWGETNLWDWMLSKSSTVAPPAEGETILFDLGSITFAGFDHFALDSQGRMWNCTRGGDASAVNVAQAFAKVTTGRRTTVSLDVVQPFTDMGNGVTTGAPYDLDMARDGWATPLSGTSTLRLRGLTASAPYKVTVWGANLYKDGSNLRTSRYEINGETHDLETYLNTTNTAVFNSVIADANGAIDLKVYATGAGVRQAQLNVLELTALTIPPTEPPAPVDVEGALLNYSFDEESGLIVNTGSAGPAGDLTLFNAATRTAAGLGVSTGTTDRALLNNGSQGSRASAAATVGAINGLTSFTITGWMKLGSWSSGRVLLKQYNNWNSGVSFRLGATGEMILSVGRSDGDAGGNQTSVSGGYDAALSGWVFYAVTWDGTGTNAANKVKYYRGSVAAAPTEVSSITRAGALSTGASTGILAVSNDGGWASINGNLDVLRVYGSVLTPAQITQICAATSYLPSGGGSALRSAGSFTAAPSGAAPMLVHAASRQTHGAAGDFDLALPGVECRQIAGTAKVVLTFDQAITGGTVSLIGVGGVSGQPQIAGRTMTVTLSNLANAQTAMLNVANVQPKTGGTAGSASVTFKVLAGDATGDGAVTDADVEKVKAALAPDINVSNAACDINRSGTLNTSDVLVTKSNLGSSAL